MAIVKSFSGVLVPVLTPFTEELAPMWSALFRSANGCWIKVPTASLFSVRPAKAIRCPPMNALNYWTP